MFVDLGSATNSCQKENRIANSPGYQPCIELQTRAGTWLYDANKEDQRFSPKERYVTGLRNGEGFAFDAAGRLFATMHGRDQLSQNWPSLFTADQSAQLPAEEIVQLEKGADYGWPECYYDGIQNKLVLAPEYGGDGKKIGDCANKKAPVASFPGHWAPNDLLIYSGNAFPAAYQGGAFVAFHGSWNRSPDPQGGYNVVFQPLKDGKPSGHLWFSPTDLPVRSSSPARPRTGHRDWRWDLMAHFIYRTIGTGASGASSITVILMLK